MVPLPVTVSGTVIAGYRKAREFGTPSANIYLGEVDLAEGVYYGFTDVDGAEYPSLIYTGGPRPQLTGERVLESHLIGQSLELYGKKIAVKVERFIRPKKKLTIAEVKEQITSDLAQAREYFNV